MYLKNTWYVACTPDEIAEKPLGRQICGERIAFYRGKDNKVCAVEDFCPHRGAALSLGFVEDGNLVCGYHGLVMGCEGKPVAMPMQRVGGFPCVKRYPVVEHNNFIWVWPGDPDKADESLVPSFHWENNPEWAYGGGLFHVKCDYRLIIDNLMDLTHETYVHTDSIGQEEIDESPVNTQVDGDSVITSRYLEGIKPPAFWQFALKQNGADPDADVERWQESRFSPPSHVLIDVGVAHVGKGGINAPQKHKARSIIIDFITPETETTTWYFWGMARNFDPQDTALTGNIQKEHKRIFMQDVDVLEAQQRNLEANPGRRLLMLNIDSGGVQARRIIERLVKQEQEEEGANSAA